MILWVFPIPNFIWSLQQYQQSGIDHLTELQEFRVINSIQPKTPIGLVSVAC